MSRLQNKTDTEHFHIMYQFVNGNNDGSLASNKEFQICYAVIDIDIIKTKMKKIIGCFTNPNDQYLTKDSFDKHIYYFQRYLKLSQKFNLNDLLLNTIYSKNYNNSIIQKSLKENPDFSIRKIITKCEYVLKEKILIS